MLALANASFQRGAFGYRTITFSVSSFIVNRLRCEEEHWIF
jgi:hypothetical protein